ncbi:reverse transcriptase domain-containing protein [Tanacetum coccineum]|uniref:Reverse transcriptase domain-containing protein n=1 Tax=Tanacetum coccineum TaxID=301880 RepID=A0ABQ5F4B8_9ASTR
MLKGCLDKKDFTWTKEVDKAFEDLKIYIEKLPTLVAPKAGENLIVYLAASKECISAVLMAERGNDQRPVYFVSRVLQGAELNYLIMEKVVLALIHAARRLKIYFQAHNIMVMTNKPIRLLLSKPEKSMRVARWAIELGEYAIEFKPRNIVKAQLLADFLAETKEKDEEIDFKEKQQIDQTTRWKLYTNGASRCDGSRAGLMVVSPEGTEFTYALKFEFTSTNNEAEYEAVIAGLCIAKEMKIEEITVFVDSQLVSNQVNGSYEAKHDHTKQIQITKDLLKNFRHSEVQYIRRNQNKKADTLSKLASLTFEHLTKKVLVEKLAKKSIHKNKVAEAIVEEENSWMTSIIEYLVSGILPADKKLARKFRVKASNYRIIDRILYTRSFLTPWLRCVGLKQGKKVIREIYGGACGLHAGPRSLVAKITTLDITGHLCIETQRKLSKVVMHAKSTRESPGYQNKT